MSLSPQFLETLRERTSLSDIVGRRVKLTRRGHDFLGLCPFHKEKTPSFTVSDDKGFYHCFGCGTHGDAVAFLMQQENLSFREAVEYLAQRAGLPVPEDRPGERQRTQQQQGLRQTMEQAATWFQAQLASPEGRRAAQYLKDRSLTAETIQAHRLGYAPDRRFMLKEGLIKLGCQETDLVTGGLLIAPEDGGLAYDRFRGRIMFPIADAQNRVIGFGGRVLGDGEPKYLNSPETPLFHKGRVLFNLAQARAAVRDYGTLIVAEGYMDVVALDQGGIKAAVAPLGTALTEDQIQLLWRYTPEPILCFDGDAAGQRAALRGLDRALPLLKPGYSLRFAFLPPGEDPDSLIRSAGRPAIDRILAAAQSMIDVLWNSQQAMTPLDTPERRAGFRMRLLDAAKRIGDVSVQAAYRAELDARLKRFFDPRAAAASWSAPVDRATWRRGRNQPAYASGGGQAARQAPPPAGLRRAQILLGLLVAHPSLVMDRLEALSGLSLPDPALDKLRRDIIDLAACTPDLDATSLDNHLTHHGFAVALAGLRHGMAQAGYGPVPNEQTDAALQVDHILALMREELLRQEAAGMAQDIAREPNDDAIARQQQLAALLEESESRRRDLDDYSTGKRNIQGSSVTAPGERE